MTGPIRRVGVIGSGAWGTALAQVCARAGLDVALWAHRAEVAEAIGRMRENAAYLPGVHLHDRIRPTTDLADVAGKDLILVVAPAQHVRASLEAFASLGGSGAPVVLCAKGIEQGSLRMMSQVAAEVLPDAPLAVLSGPGFAAEVARALPCALTLACPDPAQGTDIARVLASPVFRPYGVEDLIGAQVGGAVKNVLAIGCGVVEGRTLGRSAHASLVTRGFAEMTRIGVALGARAETLAGLCGLGDLVLTCSSPQSRNMALGLALGRGETLAGVLSDRVSVAEGVTSAPAIVTLARQLGVDAPICEAVGAILTGEVGIDEAIEGLLSRPLRTEHG